LPFTDAAFAMVMILLVRAGSTGPVGHFGVSFKKKASLMHGYWVNWVQALGIDKITERTAASTIRAAHGRTGGAGDIRFQ
jgi:hypothetical protein